MGKKSRAAGNAFEKRVRLDLEKNWVVDKWTNQVEFPEIKPDSKLKTRKDAEERAHRTLAESRGEVFGKLVPARPKFIFNPITKTNRMVGNSSGFPDFIAFRKKETFKLYITIGVESKMEGKLDKLEKEKCSRTNCQKYVEEEGIETNLGWFCSEECRKEVQKNVMRMLL